MATKQVKRPGAPPAVCPEPPGHLSEHSQVLWRELVPRRVTGPARLAALTVALECLDRAEAARVVIETEGMIIVNPESGMGHVHPLIRVEKDSRGTFARVWRDLALVYGD